MLAELGAAPDRRRRQLLLAGGASVLSLPLAAAGRPASVRLRWRQQGYLTRPRPWSRVSRRHTTPARVLPRLQVPISRQVLGLLRQRRNTQSLPAVL
jgi:hypothetical protein